MEDLLTLYNLLTDISGSEDTYVARAIGERPNYRIGRDSEGHPALLIAPLLSSDSILVNPVELRNVSFRPRCTCRVRLEGASDTEETLAVLKCTTDDEMLREHFLRSVSGLIAVLPDTPDEADVAGAVNRLVELFRALETPPRTSLQGVWCELFLIAQATRIRQAAVAWHAEPRALYDFVSGGQRVEVKAAIGPHRTHHFRLEQLLPQRGVEVVVASFVLEESGRGISIAGLWDMVSSRNELTVSLRERLFKILALSLGRDWRKAGHVTFDPHVAEKNLRLYDASAIPAVDPKLPAEVTEVHFKSELTDVAMLARLEVARRGGLYEAVFG